MARRVMAVEARKQVAPKKNMDSCRKERAEVTGVLSYAASGGGRGDAFTGDAVDWLMIRVSGSFHRASMCACSSMQVLLSAESGWCRISFPFSGRAGAGKLVLRCVAR